MLMSESDFALEHKLSRARQLDALEAAVAFLKANLQLLSTLDLNLYWRSESMHPRGHQRRSRDSRSARQRFTLHATLERAHSHMARPKYLHEIYIRAFRAKVGMPSD